MFGRAPLPRILEYLTGFCGISFGIVSPILSSCHLANAFGGQRLSRVLSCLEVSSQVSCSVGQVRVSSDLSTRHRRIILHEVGWRCSIWLGFGTCKVGRLVVGREATRGWV